MVAEAREICEQAQNETGQTFLFQELQYVVPTQFDPEMVGIVREVAEKSGYAYQDIFSGAGHDACYLAKVAPTSMIFVPCRDGLSHNEAEWATAEDLEAGCNILLNAILTRAER